MGDFEAKDTKDGFTAKLWRGEQMCLIGFDVVNPEDDLVGFAIERKAPNETEFSPLLNRLAFEYPPTVGPAVTGARKFPSTEAPFQKFRWIDFPFELVKGDYAYRCTKMHMPTDGKVVAGTSIELALSLDPVTYDGFLDVGFTRNFASSQAFIDKFPPGTDMNKIGNQIIPTPADAGLEFTKLPGDIYDWLGFEAKKLVFEFLEKAIADPAVTVDAFVYDFNEPDLLALLEKLGSRLRIIVDDSVSKKKETGKLSGHGTLESAETKTASRLKTSAGTQNVKRTHFNGLQHNKVFIAKKNGQAIRVTAGSTNFSFRGFYIQANNVLVFDDTDIAGLFAQVFEVAFNEPKALRTHELASKWFVVNKPGRPTVHVCFSPHRSANIALNPVMGAIELASSSVIYSIAFLNQIRTGPTKEALERLMERQVFSFGTVDEAGSMNLVKPDGSRGLVDFAFLASHSPEPFKSEWSGGQGINVHHKFVVTDFSLPSAKVFTGSSNLAPSGEEGNGDHLLMIEDCRVATAYAIEGLRVFDHLQFRNAMKDTVASHKPLDVLKLAKPTAISGRPAWFQKYYREGSQRALDRALFGN